MARNKGLASFSANFEPQMAAPLDARMLVETKADLLLAATWLANDWNGYSFQGMIVSVWNDWDNNGFYMLNAVDFTNEDNWISWGTGWAWFFQTMTFAEMITLSTGNQLIPWGYYKITDYRTIHEIPWTTEINTWPVEELILWAMNDHQFSPRAFSADYPQDEILYDATSLGSMTDMEWEWDDGVTPPRNQIIFSDITTNTFTIDKIFDFSLECYLDVNDWTNSYSYEQSDYWTGFTAVDNGNGTMTVTVLDTIDLTHWSIWLYGYAYEFKRNGWITYRKDLDKNILKFFDWRTAKFRRFAASAADYNAWTTYDLDDDVKEGEEIYLCLRDWTVGELPSTSSNFILMINDNTLPQLPSYMYHIGIDQSTYKDYYAFNYMDETTREVTFSIETVSDILWAKSATKEVDNCIFVSEWPSEKFKDVKLNNIDYDNTIFWNMYNVHLNGWMRRFLIPRGLWAVTQNYFFKSYWDGLLSGCVFNWRGWDIPADRVMRGFEINTTRSKVRLAWKHEQLKGDNITSAYFRNGSYKVWFNTIEDVVFAEDVEYVNLSMVDNLSVFAEFTGNKIFWDITNLALDNAFNNNIIYGDISDCVIPVAFLENEVKTPLSAVDFTGATHVAWDYSCEIVKAQGWVAKIKFLDAVWNLNVADVTD